MAKKYVFNSLMIIASIIAIGGLVFPFYTSYISQMYGSYLLEGSISISGLAFAFGLDAYGTDSFYNSVIRVIRKPLLMVIVVLLIILLIGNIASISIRKKSSIFFFIFNTIIGLTSLTSGFLCAFSNEIMNVTLNGEIGLEYGGILIGGLVSEGIGYGAIISAASLFILGILALSLAFFAIYDYKNEENNLYSSDSSYPRYAGNIDYTKDPYLIEGGKEVKRLFFHKKEKVIDNEEDSLVNESANNEKKDNNNEGVNLSSSSLDNETNNNTLLDEEKKNLKISEDIKTTSLNTKLMDDISTDYKNEIESPVVNNSTKKKTLEEKLSNLNKLRDEKKISEAEYKKIKEAMIEEHFSSSSAFKE